MFNKKQIAFLGLLLLFVIIISIMNPTCVMPYNPYEPFTASSFNGSERSGLTEWGLPVSKEFSGLGSLSSGAEPNSPTISNIGQNNEYIKTSGFNGLQSSPNNMEKPLDVFSQLTGSQSCEGVPYSNSKGYLCYTDNVKKLMSTRGGNAIGGESKIGN